MIFAKRDRSNVVNVIHDNSSKRERLFPLLLDTGLFLDNSSCRHPAVLWLKQSPYYLILFPITHCWYHKVDDSVVTFEQIFEVLLPEEKEVIVWNLDLFNQVR